MCWRFYSPILVNNEEIFDWRLVFIYDGKWRKRDYYTVNFLDRSQKEFKLNLREMLIMKNIIFYKLIW